MPRKAPLPLTRAQKKALDVYLSEAKVDLYAALLARLNDQAERAVFKVHDDLVANLKAAAETIIKAEVDELNQEFRKLKTGQNNLWQMLKDQSPHLFATSGAVESRPWWRIYIGKTLKELINGSHATRNSIHGL